jgi:hypothetical protein
MNFKHGDKVTCYIDGVYIELLQANGYKVTKE